MSFEFNIDEILEIAEQIERNGARFYRNAAQKIANVDKKRLLVNIAKMEDDHEQIFKTMRKSLSEDEKMMTSFDPENESSGYLKALADTRIFYEKEIDFSSIKEILKSAITAEKDSIVFYLGMKDVISDHIGKDKLDAIIREEMSHIKLLSKELIAYNSE